MSEKTKEERLRRVVRQRGRRVRGQSPLRNGRNSPEPFNSAKSREIENRIRSEELSLGRDLTAREKSRIERGRGAKGAFANRPVIDEAESFYRDREKEPKREKRQERKATKIGSKNRQEMAANRKERALKDLVKRANDIKKLNKSDIRQVRSLANQAASDYQAPKIKDLIKNTAQKTSASRSLLTTIARGASLFGAGIMMGELVRVHNQIKKNPDTRYGSTTLFKVLTK